MGGQNQGVRVGQSSRSGFSAERGLDAGHEAAAAKPAPAAVGPEEGEKARRRVGR
jgi:hypothetical protein